MKARWRTKDGVVEKTAANYWANMMVRLMHQGGTLKSFCRVTSDLNERKVAGAILVSASEEASELESNFQANMSREIRRSMHGMLSALLLLRCRYWSLSRAE